MKRISSPCRNLRKLIASVWPFVVCLLVLSLITTAQTKTNSKSLLAGRAATRASDLKVSFTYGPKFPTEGQSIQFADSSTGSTLSWNWDFGDGSTSTAQNPSHRYSTSGFRKVTLIATDKSGSRKSVKTITIMPGAAASFVFSPTTPGPGQSVQFADTSSGDPTSWQWDFGDGATSTSKNPTHVFQEAAFYTVTLISSNSSSSKQGSKTITVASMSLLSSSFNYAPALPTAGQMVQFTDMSAGPPTSWQWAFGDGTSSTAQNASHAFAAAGFYNVTLTVATGSESKSMSRLVTIAPATLFDASFAYNPTSPVDGQAVIFTDTSIGSPTSWLWDFADGTISTSQSPSHTFATSGAYNVSLTVTSGSGSDSMSQTINVSPVSALTADFGYTPSSPVLGQAMNFADTSTGNPASWQWDFGDGSTSTVQNPSYTYAAAGAYSVALTISAGSSSNTQSKNIVVTYTDVITAASPSFADVSAAIATANQGDTVIIPAGSATWAQRLEITKPIRLIGAGIGSTIITSDYHPANTSRDKLVRGNYLITYYPSDPSTTADVPCQISGFTLNGGAISSGIILYNPTIYTQKYVRIDHLRIYNLWGRSPADSYGGRPLQIYGEFFGVMDNCTIGEVTGTYITVDSIDTMWATPGATYDYGSANMFFFEDNQFYGFNQYMLITSEMSARFCVRHNDFDGTGMTTGVYPVFDSHGNQPGAHCATMGVEIYENTLKNNYAVSLFDHRGGKALVYHNDVIMTAGSAWTPVREEYNDGEDPTNHPPTNAAGQPQHASDGYYWGNTRNGVRYPDLDPYVSQSVDYSNTSDPHYYAPLAYKDVAPQENREFWHEQDSFDGRSGVGVGLLTSRPATCTKGVAYWATDTNTLYKCTATNTWTAYYTPFTYPHPLRTMLSN